VKLRIRHKSSLFIPHNLSDLAAVLDYAQWTGYSMRPLPRFRFEVHDFYAAIANGDVMDFEFETHSDCRPRSTPRRPPQLGPVR
jgi:hypothetical protein